MTASVGSVHWRCLLNTTGELAPTRDSPSIVLESFLRRTGNEKAVCRPGALWLYWPRLPAKLTPRTVERSATKTSAEVWSIVAKCQQPHTVMKTVRRTVYEQKTEQRMRTEYQTVTEDKVINTTRMTPRNSLSNGQRDHSQASLRNSDS